MTLTNKEKIDDAHILDRFVLHFVSIHVECGLLPCNDMSCRYNASHMHDNIYTHGFTKRLRAKQVTPLFASLNVARCTYKFYLGYMKEICPRGK
jgi:hypothetical protein